MHIPSLAMLKRTPFHDFHVATGARLVDFAGWEMPIVYKSIVDEHVHTRQSGSLFDVSHMGRLQFTGPDAVAITQRKLSEAAIPPSVAATGIPPGFDAIVGRLLRRSQR